MKTEKLNSYLEIKQRTDRDIYQSIPNVPTLTFSPSVALSALNVDWLAGTLFTKSISSATTFTFSNDTDGMTIIVRITNTSTAPQTITWPANVVAADTNIAGVLAGNSTKIFKFTKVGSLIYAQGPSIYEIFNTTLVSPSVASGFLHYKAPKNLLINSCVVQLFEKNGVVSGLLNVDVKSGSSPDNATMTSIFSSVPSIDFSTANDYAISNGTINTQAIPAGNYLRLDVTSIPSGWSGNLQVLLNAF